ncbi:hypothetical protein Mapa_014047 [Marchantia paleacea]|nr:hypothetical protein Mapa_014047 [Marchantia paleacea]
MERKHCSTPRARDPVPLTSVEFDSMLVQADPVTARSGFLSPSVVPSSRLPNTGPPRPAESFTPSDSLTMGTPEASFVLSTRPLVLSVFAPGAML